MSNETTKRPAPEKPLADSASFHIRMPDQDSKYDQDEEFCILEVGGEERTLRFHNYDEIYALPGLYERLFYDLLECNSPKVVCDLLGAELDKAGQSPARLRVLDLGAGNGIVGEELRKLGAQHVVGADIIPEAAASATRDRPDVYADYRVVDITDLSPQEHDVLVAHRFNALTCVAALGFGDIPPAAFSSAFNLVADGGWIAFTLKERFLSESDGSGFGRLIKRCADEGVLEVRASERYRHRLSMAGEPLYYTAMIATKHRDIPDEFVA
jgi:2-polyprenyl-3-methyl-5-hydroxy-6-metoxy-1,4-benzoquinol methylase